MQPKGEITAYPSISNITIQRNSNITTKKQMRPFNIKSFLT